MKTMNVADAIRYVGMDDADLDLIGSMLPLRPMLQPADVPTMEATGGSDNLILHRYV